MHTQNFILFHQSQAISCPWLLTKISFSINKGLLLQVWLPFCLPKYSLPTLFRLTKYYLPSLSRLVEFFPQESSPSIFYQVSSSLPSIVCTSLFKHLSFGQDSSEGVLLGLLLYINDEVHAQFIFFEQGAFNLYQCATF